MTRKKSKLRQKKVKLRKNFFPTLILIILFWVLGGLIVYFVDPATSGIVPIFLLTIFLALLFTTSTVFANTRRGLITASALTFFLILSYLGIGNIINFLLILGIAITLELYLDNRKG